MKRLVVLAAVVGAGFAGVAASPFVAPVNDPYRLDADGDGVARKG